METLILDPKKTHLFFLNYEQSNIFRNQKKRQTSRCVGRDIPCRTCDRIWWEPVLVKPNNKLNIADLRQYDSQSLHHS